jgi:hypothetical protein
MISDEKVGPNGVKVRCKKCGNQITVRRAEEAPAAPMLERSVPPSGKGLDEELGSAFDNAFGAQPAPVANPTVVALPAAEPVPAPAEATPPPAAQEWYVAIGEAQVGPLPLVEVKKRWEAGEIGPDSLVWRPGMAEWGPLSGVPDLAAFLAPVPQPKAPSAAPAAAVFAAPSAAQPRQEAPQPQAAPAAPEVEWKPSGASALAALASEEMATRTAAPVEKATPARSVMEQLPDSGGVDPTGAIPLPIRAMEKTDERPVHRSSVARGAEELRHKRTMRTVVTVAVLAIVLVTGGAFAWVQFATRPAPQPAQPPVAQAPAPPPPSAEPAPPPPTVPTPAVAATNQAAPPPVVAAAPPPANATVARPVEPPAAKKPKVPPPVAAGARPVRPPVAQAPPAARPAAEKPTAAAPGKKKDGLLDFDQGGDDDLAAALGSSSTGRKVYVPPAAGASTAAPDRLSDGQIMESVKLYADNLRRCVGEQQAREPGVKGTIKVAWVIQADGNPRDVRCLTPEYAQGEFAKCMIGVVRAIRFPRVGDPKGQPVTFPFQF